MREVASAYGAATENVLLFREQLQACNVKSGETVVVFTDTQFNPTYAASFLAAAQLLGAEAVEVCVPSTTSGLERKVIRDVWLGADLVIGCTRVPWLYSRVHDEARQRGVRTLMVVEPVDTLRRLHFDPTVRERGLKGVPVLEEARVVHITSPAGTDLIVPKHGRPAYTLYGVADSPGKWDHWPQGLVCFFAGPGAGEGTVVVDVGDILLPLRRHATERTELIIRDGRLIEIRGGAEAGMMRAFFEQAGDRRAYELCHVGWGTEHRANWAVIGMDSESKYGSVMIAFGRNIFWPVGGENDTALHWDTCLLNHTFVVDGTTIVERGTIVAPGLGLANGSGSAP